jgi:ABC-type multidrug transport system ATPase subunit
VEGGAAVIVATHSAEDAAALAARAVVLDAGRVVYAGSVGGAREALGG